MQKRTLLAALTAAAATAFVMPSVSRAQDPPPTPPPATQTAKGEVALQPNFDSLIAALDSTAAQTTRFKAITELSASNVQLVNIADLVKAEKEEALTAALKKAESDVAALRAALGANTTVSDALKANTTPLTADDVVATEVTADGKVIVYYWKKA